jgi:glycolate oxidase iron-sulfur subunit
MQYTNDFNNFLTLAGVEKPSNELMNSCVRCGLCLQSCPTYTELGVESSSPRGRVALIRGIAEGRLKVDTAGFLHQMDECLGCLACQAICPSGVQYGHLLEAGRAQVRAVRPRGGIAKLLEAIVFRILFMRMAIFRLFARILWFYQRTGMQWLARQLGILKAMGLADSEQLLPKINNQFFTAQGQRFLPTLASEVISAPEARPFRRVALLAGCAQSVAFAHVHEATVHALQVNGCEVIVPIGQECCGALHQHGGDFERAKQLARRNIDALEAVNPTYVVVNAAGCSHHLKEYAHILRDDPVYIKKAERLVAKSRDIIELLAELGPKSPKQPLNWTVTYQEPCHLAHGQKVTSQPRQILQAIPGLELREMAESSVCCGSAGTYNIMQPEMAQRLLDRKMNNALDTQAKIIASANTGCMIQMQVGVNQRQTPVKIMHVVEILDAAYRTKS